MSLMTEFAQSLFRVRDMHQLAPCHHCYEPTTDRFRKELDAPLCVRCASVCETTGCDNTNTPRTRADLLERIYHVIDTIDACSAAVNATAVWPVPDGSLQAALPRSYARVTLQKLSDDVFLERYSLTRALQTLNRCCPLWRSAGLLRATVPV